MFRARATWVRFAKPLFNSKTRPFCTNNNKTTKPTSNNSISVSENNVVESNVSNDYHQAYKQLDKLDFVTAAKMLFTDPPKKKKFGFDFHLVQFFFACMPSLAVYLVAQYARYDMRKMEAVHTKIWKYGYKYLNIDQRTFISKIVAPGQLYCKIYAALKLSLCEAVSKAISVQLK